MEISLSDEEMKELRKGEEIKMCVKIREPWLGSEVPRPINILQLQMTTSGLVNVPDVPEDLIDEFEDVDGVEEQLEEGGYL